MSLALALLSSAFTRAIDWVGCAGHLPGTVFDAIVKNLYGLQAFVVDEQPFGQFVVAPCTHVPLPLHIDAA